ncbi:hypothetical protein ACFUAC_35800 [Streptomyces sp. NPDC057148]|uniref:hypothetical protein n=1 Tax=unclassified Streptomyces TaxID=2593676 RepID=UPI0036271F23
MTFGSRGSDGPCSRRHPSELVGLEQPAALFIAADTGHRYVDTVFARYGEASRIEDLAPRQVRGTDELALPWSRMDWNGSSAPVEAVLG